MLRVQRDPLGRNQREFELLEVVGAVNVFRIESSVGVLLGNIFGKFGDLKPGIPNVVVGRKLVPIENCELHTERSLVLAHMEEELLVPHRIEGMADDACSEDLLTE